MYVADNIERTSVVPFVGPKRLTCYRGSIDTLDAGEFLDLAEPFALKASEAATHFRDHPLDDLAAKSTVRSRLITRDTNVDAGIEYDGDG